METIKKILTAKSAVEQQEVVKWNNLSKNTSKAIDWFKVDVKNVIDGLNNVSMKDYAEIQQLETDLSRQLHAKEWAMLKEQLSYLWVNSKLAKETFWAPIWKTVTLWWHAA